MTVDEIRKQIDSAFASASYPGDQNIGYDTTGNHRECTQVAYFFRGKHWRQLTQQDLRDNYRGDESACLCFMSAEAYQFYLPAYMLFSLDPDSAGNAISDSAFYSLLPPADASQRSWWQRRASTFDHGQRQVIVAYLQFLLCNPTCDCNAEELQHAIDFWMHEVV